MSKLLLPALLLMMAACTSSEGAYDRPGTWQPEGANAGNIAVMVADKRDLIRGRSNTDPTGAVIADAAIDRLVHGKLFIATSAPSTTPSGGQPGGSPDPGSPTPTPGGQ